MNETGMATFLANVQLRGTHIRMKQPKFQGCEAKNCFLHSGDASFSHGRMPFFCWAKNHVALYD